MIHLPGQLAENLHRVLAGDPADADDQEDGRQAQALAAAETHPATAPTVTASVHHVVTAATFFHNMWAFL